MLSDDTAGAADDWSSLFIEAQNGMGTSGFSLQPFNRPAKHSMQSFGSFDCLQHEQAQTMTTYVQRCG